MADLEAPDASVLGAQFSKYLVRVRVTLSHAKCCSLGTFFLQLHYHGVGRAAHGPATYHFSCPSQIEHY